MLFLPFFVSYVQQQPSKILLGNLVFCTFNIHIILVCRDPRNDEHTLTHIFSSITVFKLIIS